MQKRTLVIAGIAVLAVAAVGGVWALNFALGDSEPASGPITAIPVVVSTSAPAASVPTQAGESAPAAAEATAASMSAARGSGLVIFQISQDQSEARLSILEELAGQPNTVIGTTSQVAGEVAVDMNDLSKTQVGVIQVKAGTFVTDNDRRNGAIRRFILNSDQYEFITFTPTAITGLSGAAQPGQPFTFEVVGELTIRDVTQPAVFTVTAQGESAARISGAATPVVKRSDFGLTIPNVPNVANVGNDVTIEFDFVAVAAG